MKGLYPTLINSNYFRTSGDISNENGSSATVSFFVSKNKFRLLLISFLLIFTCVVNAQTVSFNLDTIAYSNTDLISPGRGVYVWSGQNMVNVPSASTNTNPLDAYYRFQWNQFEDKTQGSYNWSAFDAQINSAISSGQKFSFGIMELCSACSGSSVGGGTLYYPTWLHNAMQAESTPDWITPQTGMWVPNWNSPTYLSAVKNICVALNNHINSTSYNGVPYKNVIGFIDIRFYGDFGEWHAAEIVSSNSDYPSGTKATVATLDSLISYQIHAFENFSMVTLIAAFDGNQLANTMTDPAVGYFALTTKNSWGKLGWRRDNFGDLCDSYIDWWTDQNNTTYNGIKFSDSIMARYKYAPVTGEPYQGCASNGSITTDYGDLERQVRLDHATSFGNGNYSEYSNSSMQNNIRAASKACGYRLQVKSGTIGSLSVGNSFPLTLNWSNIGITPTYENWNVQFELRNGSTVLQTWTSSFNPRLFSPGTKTVTDNLTLSSSIATGTYNLYLIIRDPNGYRKPLALANANVLSDGSYLLSSVVVGSSNGPIIALSNQAITLPTSSVNLTGTITDLLSTVSTNTWTQVSGPNTATISSPSALTTTASGLIAGTYVFQLKVVDLLGLTATATMTVVVNPAPTPPTVTAGSNQTITLPTNTTSLTATATAGSGTINSYSWTETSGPNTATIKSASSLTTTISGLVAGTYVFRIVVKDSNNLSDTATITVVVNAAANQPPTANAGANQAITLPTNTATLDGSASSDPDGTIASYSWTKISGPSTGTITNANTSTATLSNLVQGTYIYQLTVTDNSGATASDTTTVTVNAAANQPPVANAGSAKTITLPTNSVSLNGSASSDPDGTIAGYKWSQVSGPSTATITNSTTATPTVSALVAGTYVFQLTVTDNSGSTSTAQVKVIVNAAANQPPVANAGASQTITLPTNTSTLDGSGSQDPDGTIASYSWTKISGPTTGTITNANTVTATLSNLVQGTYTYQLTVTDNNGATASDTVTVTVNAAPNQAPVANAGSSKTITLPTNSVSLDGSKSYDPDGTIASYNWTQTSGPSTATITGSTTATPTMSDLVAGKYIFRITVTDNSGATSSAQVNVTVNSAANIDPVANAGADQTIILPADSIVLDGTASQGSNGAAIVSYTWSQLSGPNTSNIASPTSGTTTVGNLVTGTYTFQLTVTDNNGNSA
ncbi:MAG: DUF4832 domain-containing protein, partial [Bacteroidetes bacterium]|nr:DUF4832 domain-containing protein [Bacteroidota bacterium]